MKLLSKTVAFVLVATLILSSCGREKDGTEKPTVTTIPSGTTTQPENPSDEERGVNIYIEDNTFKLNGETIWLSGMNAPWQAWNDFGGNYDAEYWDKVFKAMKENGLNSCRIWISCNGDVGMNIDESGYFVGATEKHWNDLDSLFNLAKENEIYIMATLMSFDHFKNTYKNYNKWRAWLKSTENIDSYVNNYVIPFCERYDDNDYVWSIDLINEPDWVYENDECGKISWDHLGDYFARASAAIHEHTDDMLVTVGFGMIKYNSDKYEGNYGSDEFLRSRYDNENAYLDFWSTHYYDWQAPWFNSPFVTSPKQFHIDSSKPVVIGECGHMGIDISITSGKYKKTIAECYEWAFENGWNGVLVWTDRDIFSDSTGIAQFEEAKKAGNHMKDLIR